MVGYGQLGHVLWQLQDSYGSTTVTSLRPIPFVRESLAEMIEELAEANMYARFGESPYHEGPHRAEGEIEMQSHPIAMLYPIVSVFGQWTTTSDTNQQQHELIPRNTSDWDDRAAVRPANIEVHRDVGSAMLYLDMLGNNLSFNITNNELLSLTAGFIGTTATRRAASSPTFPAASPFRWAQCSASYNGWAVENIRNLTVNYNNNLETQYYLNMSHTPFRIKRTDAYQVDISGTLQFDSHSMMLDFEAFNNARFFINFVGNESPNEFLIDIPAMRFTSFQPTIGGRGLVEVSFNARGDFDTNSSYAIRCLLTNTEISSF